MYSQSFKRAAAATLTALLLTASLVGAQGTGSLLKITRPDTVTEPARKQRQTSTAQMDRAAAFQRINPNDEQAFTLALKRAGRRTLKISRTDALKRARQAASAATVIDAGTGGGDINEIEPNDQIAQGVSLPVNIFGEISFNGDVDFFAFDALAGQQITIEPFAARLAGSLLVPDIALFDTSGQLLARAVGDELNDPLIRYVSSTNQVLVVGVADIEDLGGRAFDYLLNITRGLDVDEVESNDTRAQSLPDLPVTVFGEIESEEDVDFFSFIAAAGQTLIMDIDSEVFGSHLDPEINLIDPETGVEYFYNDQYDGDDSRFNIVLPYTGRYVIGVGAYRSRSNGFYRLNASLVSGEDAPVITGLERLSFKKLLVTGTGFTNGAVVEINGVVRKTKRINSGTLRAKIKMKVGDVVTVINPPDERRSNPLIVQ